MSRVGFRRKNMGGWHLRVVEDAAVALGYLSRAWGDLLPASFYRWLRAETPGSTYRLTGPVHCPELWVIPDVPALEVAAPVRDLVLVSKPSR